MKKLTRNVRMGTAKENTTIESVLVLRAVRMISRPFRLGLRVMNHGANLAHLGVFSSRSVRSAEGLVWDAPGVGVRFGDSAEPVGAQA
jgi:hypothetical protein